MIGGISIAGSISSLVFPKALGIETAITDAVDSLTVDTHYPLKSPMILQSVPEYASTASANSGLPPGAVYMLDDKLLRISTG